MGLYNHNLTIYRDAPKGPKGSGKGPQQQRGIDSYFKSDKQQGGGGGGYGEGAQGRGGGSGPSRGGSGQSRGGGRGIPRGGRVQY